MQQGDVAITSTLAIYGLTVKVQLRAACGIHAGNQHIYGLTVKVQLSAACGIHAGNQYSTLLPTCASSATLADVLPQSGEPSSDRSRTDKCSRVTWLSPAHWQSMD